LITTTQTHTHTHTGGWKATHGGRRQAAVREREVVRLPPAQELGREDLAEEGARVLDHAHLDVALVQQLVAHAAAAVVQGPLARVPPRAQLGVVVVALRHLPQQRLALLALVELVVVQLVAAAAVVEIHRSGNPVFIVLLQKKNGTLVEPTRGRSYM